MSRGYNTDGMLTFPETGAEDYRHIGGKQGMTQEEVKTMIENLTDTDRDLIKRELGFYKRQAGSKKEILHDQYEKIRKIGETRKLCAITEMWGSITKLTDHTLRNYQKYTDKKTGREKERIYSSIFEKEPYIAMVNDLIAVVEKYKGE